MAQPVPVAAQTLPLIRITDTNRVPSCVTPDRLQRFLADGNRNLPAKFRDIARFYKEHGERLRVRWDYAFYQMIIETNYLKFVNNAGQGDVSPKQNNFAGIGTTGGGVPGDSFPDVSTGVLGQMQHLIAYSGERVANPVAARTREKQDEIVAKSLALRRPPTFKDLAGRWAVDRRYGTSIEFIASRYRSQFCTGREPEPEVAAAPPDRTTVAKAETAAGADQVRGKRGKRNQRGARGEEAAADAGTAAAPGTATSALPAGAAAVAAAPRLPEPRSSLGAATTAGACAVLTASYGGERNVLIRATNDGEVQYTALQVLDGQEQRLARAFIRSHAAGGEPIGEFPSRDAALSKAFELCPAARAAR